MKKYLLLTMAIWTAIATQAQTSSDFMVAMKKASVNIPFDVTAPGEEYRVKWGMDTAWNWDFNVNRGIAHIGKGNFETGRISFQPTAEVIDNGDGTYTLTAAQKEALRSRCKNILMTGCNKVEINNDQEDALNKENGNYEKYQSIYLNKPEAWYKLIKASVAYARECGVEVVSIAPFNEPDYTQWGQGTQASMKEICRLIRADSYFDNIHLCGGNTLNCDEALSWYNYCKEYLDEGNTHQLAGSFDSYANFFTQVKQDGKIATADELHNVGEAIVGVQYGMEKGIWWAFDSKARGQFCIDSNEGVRIGYGENRPAWTSGAVYRNENTGEVHGYLGSSERQANSSSFAFVSTTKDVFFNGYGPTRLFVYDVPGGTGYQKGQINAERLFDITWGEDVAPFEVNGTYQIVNAASRKMLTYMGTNNVQSVTRKTSGTTQQWKVYPGHTDGDISYWFIDNNTTSEQRNLNVLNNNLYAGAGVICYNANHDPNEQWYIKYAQDGYYYIINRLSNKYLYCPSTTSGTALTLQNAPAANITAANLRKYLWRFQPIDSKTDFSAPDAPTALTAKQRPGSVELTWVEPTDNDPLTYTILRAEQPALEGSPIEYNTIGRNIAKAEGAEQPTFTDNTAISGHHYLYKVIAVDYAGNRSDASEPLAAAPLTEQSLLCQLQFDDNLADLTPNHLSASLYGTASYSGNTLAKSGTKSLNLNGGTYLQLPYSAAHHDALTIATWVRWNGNSNWQRIFDFGNSTTQYMFFTPSNGSEMRFVMKNGDDEQILTNGSKLSSSGWKHLAITLQPTGDKVQATLYLDGQAVATRSDFTIRPSDIAPSLCYIGRSMFTADPYFSGRLDDFRIYNYALSADEVKALMTDTEAQSKDLNDDYEETTPIHAVTTTPTAKGNSTTYDLSGRPAPTGAKGILIQNKKKIYTNQ